VVRASCPIGQLVEGTRRHHRDEVELAARLDLGGRGCDHAFVAQRANRPAIRGAPLSLYLMRLAHAARAPHGELDSHTELADLLDHDRLRRTSDDVEEVRDGPPALEPVPELVRLATRPRAHRSPPCP